MVDRNMIKIELIKLFEDIFENINFLQYKSLDGIDLINEFGISSITLIALIVNVEERFGFTVPDEFLSFDNFKDIDKIVDIIYKGIAVEHD